MQWEDQLHRLVEATAGALSLSNHRLVLADKARLPASMDGLARSAALAPEPEERFPPAAGPPIGIGEGCDLAGAIIDKNARIGPGVRIEPFPRGAERDGETWSVRDGIVVVPKNAILPGGTHIGPG